MISLALARSKKKHPFFNLNPKRTMSPNNPTPYNRIPSPHNRSNPAINQKKSRSIVRELCAVITEAVVHRYKERGEEGGDF